jgi:glycosyl transferase family 25
MATQTTGEAVPSIPALFASFDRIWIINLPHRTDRRREMEQQLERVGLLGDPRVAFFAAFSVSDPGPFLRAGSNGLFKSHLALLDQAAAAQESVLILEDDCDFLVDALETYRMPDDWDVFYGGYFATNPDNLQESDIIGSHFMAFSKAAVATCADYLHRYTQPDFAPDPRASAEPGFNPAIRPPSDGAFVWLRRAHPELVTVFAMLGVQRASRTDIGDLRVFDRIIGLRALVELARRIRRKFRPAVAGQHGGTISFGADPA